MTDFEALRAAWKARNIESVVCADRAQALAALLERIPPMASVGISGSQTLQELGVVPALTARGTPVWNPYVPGMSREESLQARRKGAQAEYFLASPNAIARTGELVFFSAYGNRTAGIAYAPHVLVVAGVNKIASDLATALRRAREYATPRNCKRLGWETPCAGDGTCRDAQCRFPAYKRMCGQVLVVEGEVVPARMQMVLVDESLGF